MDLSYITRNYKNIRDLELEGKKVVYGMSRETGKYTFWELVDGDYLELDTDIDEIDLKFKLLLIGGAQA